MTMSKSSTSPGDRAHPDESVLGARPDPSFAAFVAEAVSAAWLLTLSLLPRPLRAALVSRLPKAPPPQEAAAQARRAQAAEPAPARTPRAASRRKPRRRPQRRGKRQS
jgi:hypothetical protein